MNFSFPGANAGRAIFRRRVSLRGLATRRSTAFFRLPNLVVRRNTIASPLVSSDDMLARREGHMMVTRVQDRFGNFITYTYSGDLVTAMQ